MELAKGIRLSGYDTSETLLEAIEYIRVNLPEGPSEHPCWSLTVITVEAGGDARGGVRESASSRDSTAVIVDMRTVAILVKSGAGHFFLGAV